MNEFQSMQGCLSRADVHIRHRLMCGWRLASTSVVGIHALPTSPQSTANPHRPTRLRRAALRYKPPFCVPGAAGALPLRVPSRYIHASGAPGQHGQHPPCVQPARPPRSAQPPAYPVLVSAVQCCLRHAHRPQFARVRLHPAVNMPPCPRSSPKPCSTAAPPPCLRAAA